jgi:hypothetical protein
LGRTKWRAGQSGAPFYTWQRSLIVPPNLRQGSQTAAPRGTKHIRICFSLEMEETR